MRKQRAGRFAVFLLAGLMIVVQACGGESPVEPEIDVEEILGDLLVEMTATSGTAFMRPTDSTGFTTAVDPLTEPGPNDIEVPPPGTPTVFSWPIIQDLPITPERRSDGELHLSWPHLSEDDWPGFTDAGPSDDPHLGNAWMIYRVDGRWVAETVEWLREPHERTGTAFHPEEKLTQGQPRDDEPVAFFVAGPSRHESDHPEFRRRTEPKWFLWADLSPFTFEDDEPDEPDPEPEPEPELEEVHVWIQGLTTERDDGAQVTFNDEVGDVELLGLSGTTVTLVDSQVPAGTYTHVSFKIDEAQSFVVFGGEELPLGIPDEPVRVDGPFVVEADGMTITLQFDVEQSLTQDEEGNWSLNPVVVVTTTEG